MSTNTIVNSALTVLIPFFVTGAVATYSVNGWLSIGSALLAIIGAVAYELLP